MTVSERIKLRREELQMTQDDLATKLGLNDKSSISKIENSGDDVTMKNVTRIATALSTTPKFLLGWDESVEESNKFTTLNHIYLVLKRDKKVDDRSIPLMFGYDSEEDMLQNIKKQGPILIPYSRVKELCDTYDFDIDYLMGDSLKKYDSPVKKKTEKDFQKLLDALLDVAKVSNPQDVQRVTDLLVRLNNIG